MIKKRKKKKLIRNQGNSFIMVVATISFLAVLVAAMLVAVALCFRLKAYDINARDNFYYLEQAMDEIYAGVGGDAMMHLNSAYDDTIEVLVYFDAQSQSYVTKKNEDANRILKNTYMKLLKDDDNYKTSAAVKTHLNSFISNPYDATNNPEGVVLSVGNIDLSSEDELKITNLVLKREALYSTVNTRKQADGTVLDGDTFVQTITTDLVIGKPEFDVNFNTIDSDLNELYKFAFVADKGIEIGDATSKVNITGNIYAAADFYNKDYNITDTNDPNYIDKPDDTAKARYAAVSSDEVDSAEYKSANGRNEKSMYSGLYINGADVFISAERIIVPGTIAAFNSSTLTVFGLNDSTYNSAEIWADSIVLGGYSFLRRPTSTEDADDDLPDVEGSIVKMRANAYISDDLELNAEAASFSMVGQYYGYNYATTDNRSYTDVCREANGDRTFTGAVSRTIADGETLEGQAHYNSSAIIVNGQDSSLDLSGITDMYIAGQSYIETSKVTKEHKYYVGADGKDTTEEISVTNKNNKAEVVTVDEYIYPEQDATSGNYTTNSAQVADPDNNDNTSIQDYRTGEAISIKSNQLAYQLTYIPNWAITDTEDGLYLSLPVALRDLDIFKDNWEDLANIPIIKTVVSGKVYYFFDFSTEATVAAGLTQDVMNNFIAAYTELFTLQTGETMSQGDTYGLTDITDYEHFQVEMLKVNTTYDTETGEPLTDANGDYAKIYTNSAITVKNGTSFTIKAKSSSIEPLKKAATNINYNIAEQNKYIENQLDQRGGIDIEGVASADLANDVTTRLQSQYQEVKWTLTPTSSDMEAVDTAHSMEESDITPINYFFYFNKLGNTWNNRVVQLKSGYYVWVCNSDVYVTDDNFPNDSKFQNGHVKGMIICKGNVTFDEDIDMFEGLIVSGSKVIVNHSMNFMANEEVIKTILRECDESQTTADENLNLFEICELFQKYQSIYKEEENPGSIETESAKSITAVQFEDVLSFENWMKNVD